MLTLPADCLPPVEADPDAVIASVCAAWRLEASQIVGGGPRGSRRIGLARRACCVSLRRLCPSMSLQEIGAVVGLDYTTVLYHLRKAGFA
jgi:chromosomal replication initiation ATPase DnaA